jgi:hypothetical protein
MFQPQANKKVPARLAVVGSGKKTRNPVRPADTCERIVTEPIHPSRIPNGYVALNRAIVTGMPFAQRSISGS